VYEKYNKAVTSESYPDIANQLAKIYSNVQADVNQMKEKIKLANQSKVEAAEEKLRQA